MKPLFQLTVDRLQSTRGRYCLLIQVWPEKRDSVISTDPESTAVWDNFVDY